MKIDAAEVSETVTQNPAGLRGANIVLRPGVAHPSLKSYRFDGCIVLQMADGKEFMRVEPTGDVFVWGNRLDSDRKVYENFREWLGHCCAAAGWKNPE